MPCHWRLETAPGIGHDGHAMSQVCAALWFEGQVPDAARMAALAGKSLGLTMAGGRAGRCSRAIAAWARRDPAASPSSTAAPA